MATTLPNLDALRGLLDASSRPIYALDARRRIVYCNSALAGWLDLEPARIIGRLVEYHSEPAVVERPRQTDAAAPLSDLCPLPRALAGEACTGTISCVARGGRLIHRHASFVPLGAADEASGVLVLAADRDLSPQELAAQIAGEPSADELHRAIRRFRRSEVSRYAVETLLGDSAAMQKVRAQVMAAAASGANTLIAGRPGTGRAHVARAIHYQAVGDADVRLLPIDCEVANDDLLRRAIDAVSGPSGDPRQPPTLLLENLHRLAPPHQSLLLTAIVGGTFAARVIATCGCSWQKEGKTGSGGEGEIAKGVIQRNSPPRPLSQSPPLGIEPALLDAISTITIYVPRLAERPEDLPLLAQFFLEACNRGSERQVGSLRPEALDLLALYTWPGELDELRQAIAAAHRSCSSHEIRSADLPAVVHHAAHALQHGRRQPERIVLDELLANIEREAITRALAQARGNKSAAADLLGMTRPRLYRRLLQLGLAGPEFVENEDVEETP